MRTDGILEQIGNLAQAERGGLLAIARHEGLAPDEALECVQDALCTFLSKHRAAPPVVPNAEVAEPSGCPPHALATIKVMVRNAARNRRRRHHRLKAHHCFSPHREPAARTASTEELVAQAEDVVRLRACVAELCGVQRAVVMLRLLEERSGEDVAETLGLARGHVDVLVHRAKAALRTCMGA